MHEIDTIRRLNQEAFNKGPDRYRAQGRYVVTEYAGLHLIGFETFEDPLAANAHFVAKLADRTPDARFELLAPLPPHHGNERDQSEDYLRVNRTVEELAALGASSPTRNAGDDLAQQNKDLLTQVAALQLALRNLLDDVEGAIDYGMPFSDPEHGFHESWKAALLALGASSPAKGA